MTREATEMPELIIFDFDGVVVDSELVSNGLLAQIAGELGHAMSVDEALAYFGGSTLRQQVEKLERLSGTALPDYFAAALHARTLEVLRSVKPIPGLGDFLDWLGAMPVCIGSTSAQDRIEFCLEAACLTQRFRGHVFSVGMVQRNKPAPDIFLHAAAQMGASPERTMVIEDSVHGVKAAVAAGMRVVGLAAASHLGADHLHLLEEAGAHFGASHYRDVRRILEAGPW